ncbi:hypothetical protein PILCRDRAFT_382571 [Piloderma croceum F 1598]|uniref:Uncharacterized protein n=1 Tax=Piloderma croceum (strain F 1598) TaxID=765440 RepID=A0A0C3C479_PILCF|nr:hypothetical protein PILCRDRAFT_382571 [Piloderma croceum F 1598]
MIELASKSAMDKSRRSAKVTILRRRRAAPPLPSAIVNLRHFQHLELDIPLNASSSAASAESNRHQGSTG